MSKVTIIVPIYNKEARLEKCIESVLNQTYKDFELLLINDGSVDRSHIIASEFEKKDNRIKYYKQQNRGVSFTRNIGIQLANSEFISFLDADDEINERYLEKMVSAVGSGNVCYCGHYYVTKGKKKRGRICFRKGDILIDYLYNTCTPHTNSWIIRKEFLNKYNIRFSEEINWGEDMIFFSKVLLHEKDVSYVKDYLTEYHISQFNCLSENSIDKIDKDIFWMEKLKRYILENESDKKEREKLIYAIETYRLPAGIIYRIWNNIQSFHESDLKFMLNKYSSYLRKIRVSNGLRSIKLICIKSRL
ncbi:glycosyltransferase family 2 protein [Clostridium cibarium]|uniref:Glycosyltransferase family 2 protein n=1 Tax=Clostridium cibarium TaxID=2762247 RepID=A0ABR8PYT1_9CLOT|nr:glycosyltransferase family 2 protein [Clostridium cibarium]MBD7913311.1 glycosyltransferase family 2 protein [Clostridium cibarium]